MALRLLRHPGAVHLAGRGDARVPVAQEFLHEFGVHISTEQEGGTRVPEVVEAYGRQSCPLQERLELAGVQVLAGYGGAYMGRKHETVILPEPGDPASLLQLCLAVVPQGREG